VTEFSRYRIRYGSRIRVSRAARAEKPLGEGHLSFGFHPGKIERCIASACSEREQFDGDGATYL